MEEVEILDITGCVRFLRTEALLASDEKTQNLLKAARLLEQLESKLSHAYRVASSIYWDREAMSCDEIIRCLSYIGDDVYDDQFSVATTYESNADELKSEKVQN